MQFSKQKLFKGAGCKQNTAELKHAFSIKTKDPTLIIFTELDSNMWNEPLFRSTQVNHLWVCAAFRCGSCPGRTPSPKCWRARFLLLPMTKYSIHHCGICCSTLSGYFRELGIQFCCCLFVCYGFSYLVPAHFYLGKKSRFVGPEFELNISQT